LYNTYWLRFNYHQLTFDKAIANSKALFRAAKEAGVRRVVHLSVTNLSEDTALPCFRGKAQQEKAIMQSGMSYAIVRPSLIFGAEDILINNVAWFLRRAPAFAIPGEGNYRIQPVFVDDVAEIAVDAGHQDRNVILDAVGPEIYTFDELVRLVATKLRSRARIIHLRPRLVLFLLGLLGYVVRDVVLTHDEIRGLMGDLLVSKGPPTGHTRFSEWLEQNAHRLGVNYASELARHYRWPKPDAARNRARRRGARTVRSRSSG
jgi:NADH dehydrogenase